MKRWCKYTKILKQFTLINNFIFNNLNLTILILTSESLNLQQNLISNLWNIFSDQSVIDQQFPLFFCKMFIRYLLSFVLIKIQSYKFRRIRVCLLFQKLCWNCSNKLIYSLNPDFKFSIQQIFLNKHASLKFSISTPFSENIFTFALVSSTNKKIPSNKIW